MFGHDDDEDNNKDSSAPVSIPEPVADASLGGLSNDMAPASSDEPTTPVPDLSSSPDPDDNTSSEPSQTPIVSPSQSTGEEDLLPAHASGADTDDLLNIKQKALQQLSPLVGHLDQSPEEKFRTTMMMIQAADDQTLISTAYEAAQEITDEKARAQALLDIVNEINYFTQQSKD
jgi:hypothetical protein